MKMSQHFYDSKDGSIDDYLETWFPAQNNTYAKIYNTVYIRHKTHVCGINVPLYPESD